MMFWNKRIFVPGDYISVTVVDVAATERWYSEKLGLDYSSTEVEEASAVPGYFKEDPKIYLCDIAANQRAGVQPARPPILSAKKVEVAHEYLASRGVAHGPLRSDSGGNRFFRFRDLEGNEVEVCQDTRPWQ